MEQTVEQAFLRRGVSLEPAEEWEASNVDTALFEPGSREAAPVLIGQMQSYLGLPYMHERFLDDSDRLRCYDSVILELSGRDHERRKGIEAEVYAFTERHCTHRGTMNRVFAPAHHIAENFTGADRERLLELTGAIFDMRERLDTYDTAPSSAKIEFAKELKQKAYAVLEFLDSQSFID